MKFIHCCFAAILALLLSLGFAFGTAMWSDQQQYIKRGKTQFLVTKDHHLQPVYPVKITVEQDQGMVLDPGQAITCEIVDHVWPIQQGDKAYSVHRTELKCGDNHFIVDNVLFSF